MIMITPENLISETKNYRTINMEKTKMNFFKEDCPTGDTEVKNVDRGNEQTTLRSEMFY